MAGPIYNKQIRSARGKIAIWMLAEKLKIRENTLHEWLKKPLPENKKAAIYKAIHEIKNELKKNKGDY
ncbi:hypothetical protein [Heyndrickxia acidicola]|uniref:Uncharacterized protein n=1 Tax=Heyndrickxia acidicola TaxID=209389 RepID=A0ABU6MMG7_9BACI|nr:hypothetical protein [Heyndrickxia acidicola]MED1205886.1 hypothetical protein [Heyndrickxia acidicola]